MKIKVAELKDARLDYWVARAEGHILKPSLRDGWQEVRTNDGAQHFLGFYPSDPDDKDRYEYEAFYSPSTSWADGGPIIEREGITICPAHPKGWSATIDDERWEDDCATPLIAAMRAFVASKFGEEVEE